MKPQLERVEIEPAAIHYSEIKLISPFHHTPRFIREALAYEIERQVEALGRRLSPPDAQELATILIEPDVLLTDIAMPVTDGYAVLERLKAEVDHWQEYNGFDDAARAAETGSAPAW